MIGGDGDDRLFGGAGADTFQYPALPNSGYVSDHIMDFNAAQGDKIDLSMIDAMAHGGANDAFHWIGKGAFTKPGSEGELRWQFVHNGILIQGDVDGDRHADFGIVLVGATSIDQASVIL